MNRHQSLRVVTVPDLGQPLDVLFSPLTASERKHVEDLPSERRRRQYVMGRLAARGAIRQLLETRTAVSSIEFSSELEHGPRVSVNGIEDWVSISISHSNRLAVACAWLAHSRDQSSVGIDLEYVRANEVIESYAFSRAERTLLLQALEGPEIAALAAWTVKESVWKSLLAGQEIGPDAIEIQYQSLTKGHATVRVKGELSKRLGSSKLKVRMERIERPEGEYIFSLARVVPTFSRQRMIPDAFRSSEKQVANEANSVEMIL